jgi:hypothetical protein
VDAAGKVSSTHSTVHVGPFWIATMPPADVDSFYARPLVEAWTAADSIRVCWRQSADAAPSRRIVLIK